MTTTAIKQAETLEQRAQRWMLDNHEIMALFVRFAEEKRATRQRFGIGQLTERVRWECSTTGATDPGINNNYRAYIARWLVQQDPRLAELIRCRVTPAAKKPARDPVTAPEVDPLTGEVI